MLKKVDFKKVLPHLVAIISFLVISYAYFSPLLEGKRIEQHDLTVYQGSSKEISDYRNSTGEEPLWTNSMFGGMPAYLISVTYDGNLFQYLNKALQIGPRPGSYLFLLLLGSYFLFLSLRVNPWLSMIGAIAFAFSSYNFIIILAGHNTKVVAIAYVAPVLAGIITTLRGKKIVGLAITGVFLSLQISANHPQITYYTIFIVFFFLLAEFLFSLKEKQLKKFITTSALLASVAIVAALTNTSKLATSLEYDDFSMRTRTELSVNEEDQTDGLPLSYATSWSYGINETMTMLIPGFKGGSSTYELDKDSHTYAALAQLDKNYAAQFIKSANMYWGPQSSTSGPVYFGAIVMFLFVLGMFILDNRYKWWILSVSILAILLAWGKNFMPLTEFFMHHFPAYNKFRTVSMILVIPQIVLPILAFLSLQEILFNGVEKKKLLYGLKWSAGITLGLCFIFLLIPGMAGDFSSASDMRIVDALSGNNPQARQMLSTSLIPALEADRMAMLRGDSFRSLIFILLTAGLLYFYKIKNIKISAQAVLGIVAVLIIADMWPVNKRFLDNDQFVSQSKAKIPYTATKANQTIQQISGLNERVLNLTVSPFQDASTSYFHPSLGGYHGAKMRRFQDLIETRLMDEMSMFIDAIQSQDLSLIDSVSKDLNILNMLNTKFFILNPNGAPFVNNFAFGNAWLVDQYVIADSADHELALTSNEDLTTRLICDKKFHQQVENNTFRMHPGDTISLEKYAPNRLYYNSNTKEQCLAVFSEMFYEKGWNAYIDGKPVEHFRANYLLRGMVVPAGNHEIMFEFKPKSYFVGEKISYAGSGILILLSLLALLSQFRKSKKEE